MAAPALLETWLAARDAASIRRAWSALPVTLRAYGSTHRKPCLHGAALLAGAMLGERADWILSPGEPTWELDRVTDDCFLDHCWNITTHCREQLRIHERREGLRGVQVVSISSSSLPGEQPGGGGVTAVRIFDRDRAASVAIDSYGPATVATIGKIDLTPLDLLAYSRPITLGGSRDLATLRALIAQLVAEVDAHYDTSAAWAKAGHFTPGQLYVPELASMETFTDGVREVSVAVDRHDRLWAQVHGLAWGQQLVLQLSPGTSGYLTMRFSNAELDRIEARARALHRDALRR